MQLCYGIGDGELGQRESSLSFIVLPTCIDKIHGYTTDLYVITNCVSHDETAQKITDWLPIVCLYAEK